MKKIDYINSKYPVIITCKSHGDFSQTPNAHLSGQGCPKCGFNKVSEALKSNKEDFIEKAKLKHGDMYDYHMVKYSNTHTIVIITCGRHGDFPQTPNAHLSGQGCPKCSGRQKSNTQEFIEKANKIHKYKYGYEKTDYTINREPVIITCRIHGDFPQKPDKHLSGNGCPSCAHSISKQEIQWLDQLNIPDDTNHRQVRIKIEDKNFKVDGFDPLNNIIYEFYGDHWHGNPNIFDPNEINKCTKTSYGELYQKTIDREKILTQAGYKVISIWESDFELHQLDRKLPLI